MRAPLLPLPPLWHKSNVGLLPQEGLQGTAHLLFQPVVHAVSHRGRHVVVDPARPTCPCFHRQPTRSTSRRQADSNAAWQESQHEPKPVLCPRSAPAVLSPSAPIVVKPSHPHADTSSPLGVQLPGGQTHSTGSRHQAGPVKPRDLTNRPRHAVSSPGTASKENEPGFVAQCCKTYSQGKTLPGHVPTRNIPLFHKVFSIFAPSIY